MKVVILANAPEALTKLCGVSLLERLLRILQRLGFAEATIVSSTPDEIRAAIEPSSWARSSLATRVISQGELQSREPILFLPGNIYCDARLIRTLAECSGECALIDSAPPNELLPVLRDVQRSPRGFVSGAAVIANYDSLGDEMARGRIALIDAAQVPAYVVGMRRNLRPLFFPAPPPEQRRAAERIILDTGQNGTLDIPAILHSPVETWIMRWLCRTSITPNQITCFGLLVGAAATVLFARGHLWWGMIPALALGVIDGLDGKQARVKIETTKSGKWEHVLDSFVEASWWAALALWFWRSGQLPNVWWLFAVIMVAELVDQLAKKTAHQRIDRLLDDFSPFDRFVRRIGARRDIYLSLMVIGLALGVPAHTYELCACWGAITAAVHVVRATMITAR
ncbi:MAG: CDP-alcohol phosphatidyltransferase family protein [Chthoniobacterales bacterium]